ncbi:E3 ubiquitin-protein ligase SDIR1-like [Papaver somniferum]|uniref:E3 ubiquitin-protein ligase SDIR1-like n=1 Tax=Papaver somniferum TaxID=3469 RepID=UPI000E7024DE|nr:E3 ubiquitin-protein ligase SDIR1-like [Papaver somniferum]XP_026444415.1 E3 ubiquitin-protein ligase SDIR1-like [Papaver somniferum]
MSYAFRGARPDIESGFAGVIPHQRPSLRIRAARPNNTNSFAFLFTVFLLFMILNSNQISPRFLVWLVFGVFLVAAIFRMYEICRQIQAQSQVHAGGSSDGLQGQTEVRLHMPSSLAIAARGGLHGLRLQLALLGHNFDELEFETLGAVDSYNISPAPSMSDEEINALPIHKYRVTGQESEDALQQQSSSSPASESNQVSGEAEASQKSSGDELTCSVCLEQVNEGEIIRTLPCLHQFHSSCIDPWLRQQGTCPVCKFRANEWQE